MKKTTRGVLVNLTLVGLVVGSQTAVAQEGPLAAAPTDVASILFKGGAPVSTETPNSPTTLDDPPEPMSVPGEFAETLQSPFVTETELPLSQESFSVDGETWGAVESGCALDACCAICGGGDCCPPTWYARHEIRVLGRNRPRDNLMSSEFVFVGGLSALEMRMTSRSAPFDVTGGYSFVLGRYLGRDTEDRDRFLEFAYWGLNNWRESRQVNGGRLTDSGTFPAPVTFGSLFSPFEPTTNIFDSSVGGFNRADEHLIRYQSDIDNFELNLRLSPRGRADRLVMYPNGRWQRECQEGCYASYLFGLRLMTIDETFEFRSRGVIQSGGVPGDVSGDYFSRSYNDLVGLQFGAELMYQKCKYSCGLRAKAGPYMNFSSAVIRAVNDAAADPFATTPIDFRSSANKDEVAFIGECGVVGTYKVHPNVILRASYDIMWVVGIAMAPDQVTFQTNPPAEVNANATGYYQGLSLGFDIVW